MANEQKFVKPREGLIVRDPIQFSPLPVEGSFVPWNSYWRRRYACGDVVLVEEKENKMEVKTDFIKKKKGS